MPSIYSVDRCDKQDLKSVERRRNLPPDNNRGIDSAVEGKDNRRVPQEVALDSFAFVVEGKFNWAESDDGEPRADRGSVVECKR